MTLGGPTIFISYKRDHDPSLALVSDLEAALTHRGFRVLRDVHIELGEPWPDELWRWLMECSGAVAVVCDEATESDWCRREWSVLAARHAHTGLQVIPVHIGPVDPRANILDQLQAFLLEPGAVDGAVRPVVERLRGLEDAPPTAADYLAAHRAWLGWQYREAPALGREPFSLAEVYMETECGDLPWERLRDDRTIDPFSEPYGGRADLVETVLGYFGDPAHREPVVVQGPAGSGKSAFTLRLANRLADEGLRPVLVRFRDLRVSSYDDIDELLQDAVRVGPVGEHPPPPTEPLFGRKQVAETMRFRDARVCRTVVILDGWDEVTLTGSKRFQDQIEDLLPRLRERFTDRPGAPVRLLLTGRPSAMVERSRILRSKTPVLTIRPLRPDQLRDYAGRVSSCLTAATTATGWTLDVARCESAFASYDAWFPGTSRDHWPQRQADAGTDVLGSPLLALLAFRTLAERADRGDDLFAQPTALYNALIEITVRHAGKADDGPEGTVHRGGHTLRRLLQRVATVITAQGGETISFDELDRRLEDDAALRDWANQATSESTLHELVVNFYFKGHPELGCEFLHKSFREYLFAEAIVAALEAASQGRAGPQPPPPREWGQDFAPGTVHHAASRSLASLLAPQWLTPDVRTHLFWLIERAASTDPDRWVGIRDLLNDVYGWWGEGVPLRMQPERRRGRDEWQPPLIVGVIEDELPRDGRSWSHSPSTNQFDGHLGDALLQLTAFVHSLLAEQGMTGSRHCQVGEPGSVRFRPFNNEAQGLIACIASAHGRPQGAALAGAHLPAVDLSGERLDGCDLSEATLDGADLTGTSLIGANLAQANLAGANLALAVLTNANLTGADLTGAALTQAELPNAGLTNATLINANMAEADLVGARLTNADLTRASLVGADMTRASISYASLYAAHLGGANMLGADVRRADLREADLDGANLVDVVYDESTMWPAGFEPPKATAEGGP